jgi:gliding motility-associated-like protein
MTTMFKLRIYKFSKLFCINLPGGKFMKRIFIIPLLCAMLFSVTALSQSIVSLRIDPQNGQAGICKGMAIQLTGSPTFKTGLPPVNFRWYPRELFGADSTANPVYPKPTKTTIFKVKAWVDNETPLEAYLTVTVNDPPVLNLTSIPTGNACTNQPINIFANAENYKDKPRWEYNGTGKLNVTESKILSPVYIPAFNQTGTITITLVVDPLDFCPSSNTTKSISLSLNEAPVVNIQTPDKTICDFEKLSVSATASNYDSFKWKSEGGSGSFLNGNSLNPTYVPGAGDKGKTRVILEARKNECFSFDTLTVNVNAMSLNFTPDPAEFCKGVPADLGVTPDSASYTYLWSTGATTSKIKISPVQNTSYWVQVNNKICSSNFRDTVSVKVIEVPLITKVENITKEHKIEVSPLGQFYKFTVNGKVEQDGSGNSFVYLPYYGLADTVFISASIKNKCPSATMQFGIPEEIWVNAFSPNGDGTNDRLLPGRRTTVFDRTQNIMYDGWDGWDGTYDGKEMPIGTYFYVLYNMKNKIIYKGPVTLLRSSISE